MDAISKSGQTKLGRGSRLGMALFFGVFLAFGVGFLFPIFIGPALRMLDARSWRQAECEILTSTVAVSSGDDSDTYRVDVTYRYSVDGQSRVGSRYKFVGGSSSGRSGKEAIVGRLPPGAHTVCWVNPADPNDAVINRDPTADMWFALIPMVFVLIGAGGVGFAIFGARHPVSAAISSVPRRVSKAIPVAMTPGPLKPTATRGMQVFGLGCMAVFWNGIVSMFLVNLFEGSFQWLFALFLTPFVAVGLGLIGGTMYKAMQLGNPRTTLTVQSPRVALGEALRVAWNTAGRVDKLLRFDMVLEGREVARYRRGTDHVTDTRVFATFPLVGQSPPDVGAMGTIEMVFPDDTMHSFASGNNRVEWVLKVTGELRNWPDVSDEFPLEVGPRRL